MKCVVCKDGQTRPTLTLERGNGALAVKNVGARTRDNCDEAYVAGATSRRLLLTASEARCAAV